MALHVYSMAITSNIAGKFATSVIHWSFEDSGYATTAQAAQALNDAWVLAAKNPWTLMHPTDSTLLSIKSRCVSAPGGFESVTLFSSGNVGQRSGTTSVAALSPVLISYEINDGPHRGRLFLHGVSETDVVDGRLTNGFKNVVNGQGAIVLGNLTLVGTGSPTAVNVIWDRAARVGRLKIRAVVSDLLGTIRARQRPN